MCIDFCLGSAPDKTVNLRSKTAPGFEPMTEISYISNVPLWQSNQDIGEPFCAEDLSVSQQKKASHLLQDFFWDLYKVGSYDRSKF